MTVKQLIDELSKFDPDMTVRYDYDTGNGYPIFVRAFELKNPWVNDGQAFICLDENEEEGVHLHGETNESET